MKILLLTMAICIAGIVSGQKVSVYAFAVYRGDVWSGGAGWIKCDVQPTGYKNIDTTFSWLSEKKNEQKKFYSASYLTNEFAKRGWILDKISESAGNGRLYIFRKELSKEELVE